MTTNELIAERTKLAEAMCNADTGAFPGSKAYRAYSAASMALEAFDEAHPEVIAEIRRVQTDRVLGGKNVLGL
jgi:hypothetical protein